MRRLTSIVLSAMLICLSMTPVFAANEPTCVMLKFSNDTRFKKIDSASMLSETVILPLNRSATRAL